MDKVDELIEALAEHITQKVKDDNEMPGEIAKKTRALAELVAARACQD